MDWRTRMSGLARRLVLVCAILALAFFAGVGVWTIASRGLSSGEASQAGETSGAAQPQVSQETTIAVPSQSATFTEWNQTESPNYYRVVGPAVVGEAPAAGSVVYGALDSLGRATGAVSLITYDSMQAGRERAREDISELEPSGWGHNAEVDIAMPDGSIYHGLLFNRSHLIAKSLGGDEELRNLVTGTRTQNVGANVDGSEGGMAYAEGLARSWLWAHRDGSVYYAATPVYQGDELVARSIIVDLRSDDGALDQRVEVYNAARGFEIDYATGAFTVTEDARAAAAEIRAGLGLGEVERSGSGSEAAAPVVPEKPAEGEERLVIVTGSGKAYHRDETCRGLVNARTMEWVTVSEAEAMGRHACGICGG